MRKSIGLRRLGRKILGERFADWYRRRHATREYLKAISSEMLEREIRLDKFEGGVAAGRDEFFDRRMADAMERTEIIFRELDRRIEGLSARTGERLSDLEKQAADLRQDIETLRRTVEALRSVAVPAQMAGVDDPSAEAPSAVRE